MRLLDPIRAVTAAAAFLSFVPASLAHLFSGVGGGGRVRAARNHEGMERQRMFFLLGESCLAIL